MASEDRVDEAYEAPRLEELGTLAELTLGQATSGTPDGGSGGFRKPGVSG